MLARQDCPRENFFFPAGTSHEELRTSGFVESCESKDGKAVERLPREVSDLPPHQKPSPSATPGASGSDTRTRSGTDPSSICLSSYANSADLIHSFHDTPDSLAAFFHLRMSASPALKLVVMPCIALRPIPHCIAEPYVYPPPKLPAEIRDGTLGRSLPPPCLFER
jgi:hypothetical protein